MNHFKGADAEAMSGAAAGLSPDESLGLIETHGVGTWTWWLDSSRVSWSAGMSRILGVDHSTTEQTLAAYEQLLHPDDRPDFQNPARLISSGTMADREFRVLRQSGDGRFVAVPVRVLGSLAGRTAIAVRSPRSLTVSSRVRVG